MRVVIAVLLALAPLALATAQPRYPGPPGPPPGAVAESVTYGYADVLRVNPIYEQFRSPPREECYDQPVRYRAPPGGNPAGGTVIGAIIGLGSEAQMWIWFELPTRELIVNMADHFIEWTLAGSVLAIFLGTEPTVRDPH